MSGLHVEVNGSGPDLVLLHGWGLNVRVWDGLVEEMSERFRMITVDLPGHGQSEWSSGRGTPAEQAWLLHSTLASVSNRYSLLGWSLGAQIALDLAAAMPGQIDRLVLVAATPRFAAAPDWPYGMQPNVIAKLATQLREDYRQTVSDFLELQVRGSIEGRSVVEQLRSALFVHGRAKPEALEAGLNTLATSDLRPTLSHVRTPTLVIAGQNDRITAPAASRALAEALPDARYVEMRRAAHTPFLSHRKEFAALVERFLSGGVVDEGAAQPSTARSGTRKSDSARPGAAGSGVSKSGSVGSAAAKVASPRKATARNAESVAREDPPSRPAKKKRMKARARKKLQASSR
jgi:pimeloyl-[acyl-carrier protein] methyl ester esterase